ncbi:universal stress protein [Gordonia sp. (in: high G+C Gram-positive bacteria)]|uniref:universal stress protein n=1 Tax=Gordonia sp. (in: high G+C Gram-positive bacteria) TaxID=84139 RepID=UPI0039E45453
MNAPITAAVDGSENAHDGVRWAAAAAARVNRPLLLVSVVDKPVFQFGTGIVAAQAYADAAAALAAGALDVARSLAEEIAPEVEVSTETIVGRPPLVLRDLTSRAHLMVLGRRGLGGVAGLLLGSVSVYVSAHANCPVVVVNQTPPTEGPVVVGVDGSPVSAAATDVAFAQASSLGTTLIAVHTYGGYPGVQTFDVVTQGRQRIIDEARAGLGSRLAGNLEDHPDVPVRTVVSIEEPAQQIIEAAANAQLIVLGSRGHGGFRTLLLGSTSQAVLHVAHCPVMIVPG